MLGGAALESRDSERASSLWCWWRTNKNQIAVVNKEFSCMKLKRYATVSFRYTLWITQYGVYLSALGIHLQSACFLCTSVGTSRLKQNFQAQHSDWHKVQGYPKWNTCPITLHTMVHDETNNSGKQGYLTMTNLRGLRPQNFRSCQVIINQYDYIRVCQLGSVYHRYVICIGMLQYPTRS